MPSTNPRIALTLPPYRYDLLKRLAALQGVSMASLVSELLDEFYPVMERVCVVLEAAKQAQQTSKDGLREAVAVAEAELLPLARATLGQFDLFVERVEGVLGTTGGHTPAEVPKRPKTVAKRRANPPLVTRGSGLQTPPLSKRVKKAGNAGGKGVSAK